MTQFIPPGGVPLSTPVGTEGLTLEAFADSKNITDHFYLNSDGQLAIDLTKIPTDQPTVSGTLWSNGGILMAFNDN